jgi:DinB superfamily
MNPGAILVYTGPMKISRKVLKASLFLCVTSCCTSALVAADALPRASDVFDHTLTNTEKEFVSLVAAMPADKFGFAPTAGKFDGVRTFGQQAKHVGFVLYEVSSTLLGEKNPSAVSAHENGPENLTSKEQILQYVKDAFAYAHKAVAKLTNANLMEQTADPFDPKSKRTRVDSVGIMSSHTFDHYGQMVEYARMNGIVPPASQ